MPPLMANSSFMPWCGLCEMLKILLLLLFLFICKLCSTIEGLCQGDRGCGCQKWTWVAHFYQSCSTNFVCVLSQMVSLFIGVKQQQQQNILAIGSLETKLINKQKKNNSIGNNNKNNDNKTSVVRKKRMFWFWFYRIFAIGQMFHWFVSAVVRWCCCCYCCWCCSLDFWRFTMTTHIFGN